MQANKSLKLMKKLIGTHSGSFHADEAFACYMLLQTSTFAGADIIRTRDPAQLEKCDILVDVGGVYDPAKHRYDHHQREFQDTMEIDGKKYETRLSSAGLVYKHFGREVISKVCEWNESQHKSQLDTVYRKLYENFVEGFDGIDNGVSQYPPEIKPKYQESTNISSRVARLMPWWNQPSTDEILDAQFQKAVRLVGEEFEERVRYTAFAWLSARSFVVDALKDRFNVHESGKILVLDRSLPWKEHLFNLEAEMELEDAAKPLYILFPDGNSGWRIQAVPLGSATFENRKSLPEKWRGIRDEELSKLSGIPDCVFVHASGFIGGNKSKEGVLKMAIDAVNQ